MILFGIFWVANLAYCLSMTYSGTLLYTGVLLRFCFDTCSFGMLVISIRNTRYLYSTARLRSLVISSVLELVESTTVNSPFSNRTLNISNTKSQTADSCFVVMPCSPLQWVIKEPIIIRISSGLMVYGSQPIRSIKVVLPHPGQPLNSTNVLIIFHFHIAYFLYLSTTHEACPDRLQSQSVQCDQYAATLVLLPV